jgi:UDP-N-acetylmuramoyl-tripeptide--D-alanyl-D-alanine ligase
MPKLKNSNLVFILGLALIVISFLNIYFVVSYQQGKVDSRRVKGYKKCRPVPKECPKTLTSNILNKSLDLGTRFLLNNQKEEGNFNYEYNWITKELNKDDSQVRQAGALWGLALIYNNRPDIKLIPALKKSLEFFERHSMESGDGRKWITYPNDLSGRTGTVSLVTLSIIDILRAPNYLDAKFREKLESDLDKYLGFLVSVQTEKGHFHKSYTYGDGTGFGHRPSPYFDGESLLALTKAAKYLGKTNLKPLIFESAEAMHKHHVVEALRSDPDSKKTKGFFQWGSMSYFELATTGWPNTEKYAEIVIDLTDWMIDVHCTLERTRNTAYAYEGIIHAHELARQRGDQDHVKKLACVIDMGLRKLTSWQVGGPIQNSYLRKHLTSDRLAVRGIMNHRKEPYLRIDVTQHQMHAVILALRYVYDR